MNNSIWALWLTLSYEVANMYISVGVITALTFGVVILLRMVTNCLLEPQDRVRLNDSSQTPANLPAPWWKAANAISMGLSLMLSCC